MRAQAAKASQAVAMHQTTPHGKDQCDNCVHFIPGKTPTANGTCKVVEGGHFAARLVRVVRAKILS